MCADETKTNTSTEQHKMDKTNLDFRPAQSNKLGIQPPKSPVEQGNLCEAAMELDKKSNKPAIEREIALILTYHG
ncbi:MAG: hypothetical protein MUC59_00380 [Saprospiraceae bacterium]|jgi:hypothetical protein|nr:hypothetical protein [Saprospiraceae bacterium]